MRPVPAGGFTKPCNTTGTATAGGYPEATFTWQVSRRVVRQLRELGATVRLTRHSNRDDRWGPCVDVRGRAGNAIDADLKLSIHADGSYVAGARGFHVIAPADRAPWTDDIHDSSTALAARVRTALLAQRFGLATYVAGGDGLDVRSDLGHPQPLGRADRGGRARQHAQRGRGAGDDLAEGSRALCPRAGVRGAGLPGLRHGRRQRTASSVTPRSTERRCGTSCVRSRCVPPSAAKTP